MCIHSSTIINHNYLKDYFKKKHASERRRGYASKSKKWSEKWYSDIKHTILFVHLTVCAFNLLLPGGGSLTIIIRKLSIHEYPNYRSVYRYGSYFCYLSLRKVSKYGRIKTYQLIGGNCFIESSLDVFTGEDLAVDTIYYFRNFKSRFDYYIIWQIHPFYIYLMIRITRTPPVFRYVWFSGIVIWCNI